MPRYTVTGIPQHLASGEALGLSAFLPHYNRLAASGAQAYKGSVTGHPGTVAIPMQPYNKLGGGSGLNDLALAGTSRSTDAPNAIWPNQYYTNAATQGPPGCRYWPGAGMPVQMYDPTRPQDTTMIPVPATDLRAVYQRHSARIQNAAGEAGDNHAQGALRQATNFARWAQRKIGPVNWQERGVGNG